MDQCFRPAGNNIDKGRMGEDACAKEYGSRGFAQIARNWRCGKKGEIDLIVADVKRSILCFCEVKTRRDGTFASAGAAVDYKKRMRIRLLAEIFLVRNPEFSDFYVRFDVAEVYFTDGPGKLRIDIIESAF